MKKLLLSLLVLTSANMQAEDALESKLDKLNIPSDRVTPMVSSDKLYIVNSRYSNLNKRHEFTFSGGNNFTPDSHLTNKQMAATYRFHYNSLISGGLRYTDYTNELSASGKALFEAKALVPDSDFAFESKEVFLSYNTFYGKMRLTKERIVYFDQYISLGYGKIDLASGEENLFTADVGFAFWMGRNFSARFAVKNEFYKNQVMAGEKQVHNAVGLIEFGYLFGEGAKL
jgi:outer membrane beta-barrel protein